MKYIYLILVSIIVLSCKPEERGLTAQEIIDKTIETAGGERYKRATITFKFREHIYKSKRRAGEFQLERSLEDSSGITRDVINNTGFRRYFNDSLVTVPDSMVVRYTSSVNSVHYFAHLPYALNDRAVNKEKAGENTILGQPYYKIKITFQQEGGGADHHDEFLYWIHKENFTIDYLAYKFLVNDGGIRFRVAYNPRYIEGIRFVDYENYTIEDFTTELRVLDDLYLKGELIRLSTIETEVIEVEVRK
ncbi:MAG TPA: DUF6503 family protein [Gillisia sp.]|nr:DUF6503 family protein [Gillisia sp.]